MITFKKRLLASLSAGSMFLSIATPALAETSIVINGNGSATTNAVNVNLDNDTTVVQDNNARVYNNISSNSSTGGNSANYNTGGDVFIRTGNATTDVSVENILNSNKALVDCCPEGDLDIEVSGNGYASDNEVTLNDKADGSDTTVYQTNYAYVKNDVDADAKTGNNNANMNTGGDVAVLTGDATTLVDVSTAANANWALVGGNGRGPEISAKILDNGAYTKNLIDLDLDNDIAIVQDNDAHIYNDVDADAKTGNNNANMNTGGDVLIATGNALVDVEVDNLVNFNWADVDCGCIEDLVLKIAGNGYAADSAIDLNLTGEQAVYQYNDWCAKNRRLAELSVLWEGKRGYKCGTDVDADAKTGNNSTDMNVGDSDSDPAILTGDADSYVDVTNEGNVNVYGVGMPELPWDFDFHFSLDLDFGDLLAML